MLTGSIAEEWGLTKSYDTQLPCVVFKCNIKFTILKCALAVNTLMSNIILQPSPPPTFKTSSKTSACKTLPVKLELSPCSHFTLCLYESDFPRYISGIIKYSLFCACLVKLSIIHSRFIHVVSCLSISFFLMLSNMDTPNFVYSFICQWTLDCFHLMYLLFIFLFFGCAAQHVRLLLSFDYCE